MEQKFSRYCSKHHNKGNEQDKERVQYFSEKYDKDPGAFYEEKRKENEKQDNEFQIRVIQLFAKDLITERFENENISTVNGYGVITLTNGRKFKIDIVEI